MSDYSNNQLFSDFVRSSYDDFGQPSEYSYQFLSNWFASNSNVGKLNTLLDTCYSRVALTGDCGTVTGYNITPDIGLEEQAIYKKLFEIEYYSKQARFSLSGVGGLVGGDDWISLREGDSQITRLNRNEVSKTFSSLAKEARADLSFMVSSYLKFRAIPDQVVGDDTSSDGYYRGSHSSYSWTRSDQYYH